VSKTRNGAIQWLGVIELKNLRTCLTNIHHIHAATFWNNTPFGKGASGQNTGVSWTIAVNAEDNFELFAANNRNPQPGMVAIEIGNITLLIRTLDNLSIERCT